LILIHANPRRRVVVGQRSRVVATEEFGTPSLAARASAARRVQAAGYQGGLHFDPLIAHDGWRRVIARPSSCSSLV